MRYSQGTLALVFGLACLIARDAHAYLDPGSGSLLLQALVTSFLGALLAVKVFWHRIKSFLSRIFSKDEPD